MKLSARLQEIAERGLYVEFGSPDHAVFKQAAAALDESAEWIKAALNMVDGNDMPPNWDGMREFLKRIES